MHRSAWSITSLGIGSIRVDGLPMSDVFAVNRSHGYVHAYDSAADGRINTNKDGSPKCILWRGEVEFDWSWRLFWKRLPDWCWCHLPYRRRRWGRRRLVRT